MILRADRWPTRSAKRRSSREKGRRRSPYPARPYLEQLESRTLWAVDPILFGPATNYLAGDGPEAFTLGDFNNDGLLDAATGDRGTNTTTILRGNGDGTFTVAGSYPIGG